MDAFACWQPRYAERGISLFPVRIVRGDKVPAVRAWPKVGPRLSAQLATKYPDATAFGFGCGKRSGVTILDVDTPSETVLAEAIDRHGQTPFVVRTGGRKFHLYYRHNAEPRQIRPWAGKPIDILGERGFAVAPPSAGAKAHYEIVTGSLD